MRNLSRRDSLKKRLFLFKLIILNGNGVLKLNEFLFPRYNPYDLIKKTFSETAYFEPIDSFRHTNEITKLILKKSQPYSRKIYFSSKAYFL